METEELIKRLAADTSAVRRLRSPWVRAVFWLAIALPYVAAVVRGKLMMVDPSQTLADPRFVIEQAATFATALTAAFAAFCSVVPGFDRRMLLLPLGPLALWIASVGHGCVQDWLQFGADGLAVRPDWDCVPSATVIAIIPAFAMVVMLRRGAPLYPRLTLVLGALAVAAISNFGMQFFHFRDASIMMLFWHLGNVAVLSALAGWIAQYVLGWRHEITAR
jgi:hypothetical protein